MLALVDFFAWWHPYKSRGRRSTLARKVTSPKLKIGIASFRPNTRTHSLFVPDKPYLGTSMEARQDAAMLAFATLAPLTSRRTTLEPLVSRRAAHIPLATRRVARASLARPSQPTPASAGDNYLQFTTATAFKSLLTRRAVYTQAYYYRYVICALPHCHVSSYLTYIFCSRFLPPMVLTIQLCFLIHGVRCCYLFVGRCKMHQRTIGW